ncbi:hypothetical protein [Streptomyces sp. NPDC092952]|uniref:hypothetical protein n=1 Tax=Streptomyces sp. NPDC092952 TaxID=3366018 RepID=UPI00382CC27E
MTDETRTPHGTVLLPEGSWWDWDVVSWDPGRLRLGAGHDLSYHHGLELVFDCPVLVACPSEFQDPVFRAPTQVEVAGVARAVGGVPEVVVAFDADAGGRGPVACLIAAERLEIVQETVLRYWREDAAPGQRFAPWVRPPLP